MQPHIIQDTIMYSSIIILLLLAGVVATVFISSEKRLRQEKTIIQLKFDYEKELRTVENEVLESAFASFSRELHDNIGQLLSFLHLQIEREKLVKHERQPLLESLDKTLLHTIQQVKMLARRLNNEALEQNGLLKSIEQETERLKQINLCRIEWQHDGCEPALSKDQRLMAFRIFQEIINNAGKHSQAQNIIVRLQGSGGFKLEVQDDGVGFDLDAKMNAGGSGLKNIFKRASMAYLACRFTTTPGSGCTCSIEAYS